MQPHLLHLLTPFRYVSGPHYISSVDACPHKTQLQIELDKQPSFLKKAKEQDLAQELTVN